MTAVSRSWAAVALALAIVGCGAASADAENGDDVVDVEVPVVQPAGGGEGSSDATESDDQSDLVSPTSVRMFVFGHSLVVHADPIEPAGPDETTVPHWLGRLAAAGGGSLGVDGQYGFLRTHAAGEPAPQWGFAEVPGVWDVDAGREFGDVDFTHVLVTPANFVQGRPPTEPFEDEPDGPSPVETTLAIIDRAVAAEPGIQILVYENWPDMAAFSREFPPDDQTLAAYHEHTATTFHDWWIDYHEALASARPDVPITLVPVGSALAGLLTTPPWDEIPVTDLYEDDAPHGRPTLYFLAALVTHLSGLGDDVPLDVELSESIHQLVADDLPAVVARLAELVAS